MSNMHALRERRAAEDQAGAQALERARKTYSDAIEGIISGRDLDLDAVEAGLVTLGKTVDELQRDAEELTGMRIEERAARRELAAVERARQDGAAQRACFAAADAKIAKGKKLIEEGEAMARVAANRPDEWVEKHRYFTRMLRDVGERYAAWLGRVGFNLPAIAQAEVPAPVQAAAPPSPPSVNASRHAAGIFSGAADDAPPKPQPAPQASERDAPATIAPLPAADVHTEVNTEVNTIEEAPHG